MKRKISTLFIFTTISVILAVATVIVLLCIPKLYTDFKMMMTGVFVLLCFVPYLLLWIFRWRLPNYISISYIVFVWCTTLGGTIYGLYDIISIYDTVLHASSGVLLGAFGLYLYRVIAKDKKDNMLFVGIFTISFATMAGVLWEFWEFWSDEILGLNSQRHTGLDGGALVGHEAIRDTIYDLMADMLGAILFFVAYIIIVNVRKRKQPIVVHNKIGSTTDIADNIK